MALISRGFRGRDRSGDVALPPGQYLTSDFPVLSAGPTPRISQDRWRLSVSTPDGNSRSWDWLTFRGLPSEDITVDLHCVTKWSKLGTRWRGVSLDTLLADMAGQAEYALVSSHGGYTTNLPMEPTAVCSFSYILCSTHRGARSLHLRSANS